VERAIGEAMMVVLGSRNKHGSKKKKKKRRRRRIRLT
jgi:hypothetical protein